MTDDCRERLRRRLVGPNWDRGCRIGRAGRARRGEPPSRSDRVAISYELLAIGYSAASYTGATNEKVSSRPRGITRSAIRLPCLGTDGFYRGFDRPVRSPRAHATADSGDFGGRPPGRQLADGARGRLC